MRLNSGSVMVSLPSTSASSMICATCSLDTSLPRDSSMDFSSEASISPLPSVSYVAKTSASALSCTGASIRPPSAKTWRRISSINPLMSGCSYPKRRSTSPPNGRESNMESGGSTGTTASSPNVRSRYSWWSPSLARTSTGTSGYCRVMASAARFVSSFLPIAITTRRAEPTLKLSRTSRREQSAKKTGRPIERAWMAFAGLLSKAM
mmetsp:Transcript_13652/g.43576  ORF Transcript_13652/g.43576 Transcript_13652/m.43576 type:complete len:207 (-) Transcript_13652:671-1291(-)